MNIMSIKLYNLFKFLAFCVITATILWLLDARIREIVVDSIIKGYEVGLSECQKPGDTLLNSDTT